MGKCAVAQPAESKALTGLRGVGALLVMMHHFYLHFGLDAHAPATAGLLRKGYLGVDLFFVLSGFVIAMVYSPWFDKTRAGRWGQVLPFLVRRAARLWPLHAAVLVFILAAGFWHDGGLPPVSVLIENFTMTQAWGFSTEINVPAWSVSSEWVAYLLFPLLAAPVLRWRGGLPLGLLGVATFLTTAMAFSPHVGAVRRGPLDIYYNYTYLPVLRCLAGFILGMLAWRVARIESVRAVASTAWLGPLSLVGMLALMLAQGDDLLIYLMLPPIIMGCHFGHGSAWRVLATGVMHRIGVLSYAIYLVHYAWLTWFPFGWAPFWLELGAYLVTAAGVAVVAHHLVELPGRRLGRRLGSAAETWLASRMHKAAPLQR